MVAARSYGKHDGVEEVEDRRMMTMRKRDKITGGATSYTYCRSLGSPCRIIEGEGSGAGAGSRVRTVDLGVSIFFSLPSRPPPLLPFFRCWVVVDIFVVQSCFFFFFFSLHCLLFPSLPLFSSSPVTVLFTLVVHMLL